jgi:hypothetical protein
MDKKVTDQKSMWIGVLAITAAVLVAANYAFRPPPASALVTFKDRDFQMVTARTQEQGDTLYVMDNRTGKIAVYSYDPATRDVRPRVFGDIATLFQTTGR